VSILVAFTAGLVFWIAGWALGLKSFDAFMVTIAFVLVAVTARLAQPLIAQLTGRD
jgi:hypothetical protein